MNALLKKLPLLSVCLCLQVMLFAQTPVTSVKINLLSMQPPTETWKFFKSYQIDKYADGTMDYSEDVLKLLQNSNYRFQVTIQHKGKKIEPAARIYQLGAQITKDQAADIQTTTQFFQFDYAPSPILRLPHTALVQLFLKTSSQTVATLPMVMQVVKAPGDVSDNRHIPLDRVYPPFLYLNVRKADKSGLQTYQDEYAEEQVITLKAGTDYLIQLDIGETEAIESLKRWNEPSSFSMAKVLGKNPYLRLENNPQSPRAFYIRIDPSFPTGHSLIVPLEITLSKQGETPKTFYYQLVIQ